MDIQSSFSERVVIAGLHGQEVIKLCWISNRG
jgi:hypothetical protein